MSAVVIDAATRDKLLAAGSLVVEVLDETGAVVGKFVRQQRAEDFEPIDVPFTDEEIERHKRESPRYTAEQVEERLRRLRKCE